jgi:hypothetical protein
MRRILIAVMALTCVPALSMAATGAATEPAVSLATFTGTLGFRTQYPASWSQLQQSGQATIGTSLVWLSNQAMHDPCSATVDGGQLVAMCGLPVTTMKPGGVVVGWTRSEGPVTPDPATLAQVPGRAITVGGQPAKLAVAEPGRNGCEAIGATRAMHLTVVVSHEFQYEMTACLRGPKLSVLEGRVRQMLRTTSFTAS